MKINLNCTIKLKLICFQIFETYLKRTKTIFIKKVTNLQSINRVICYGYKNLVF